MATNTGPETPRAGLEELTARMEALQGLITGARMEPAESAGLVQELAELVLMIFRLVRRIL